MFNKSWAYKICQDGTNYIWYQFYTWVRIWYQFVTCMRILYRFFTRVRDWYPLFTRVNLHICENLLPILHIWKKWYQFFTGKTILEYVPILQTLKIWKCDIWAQILDPQNYRNWTYVNFTLAKGDILVPLFTWCEIYEVWNLRFNTAAYATGGWGGCLNAFYWRQIFVPRFCCCENTTLFSSHGGFLTNLMYHHRETIKLTHFDDTKKGTHDSQIVRAKENPKLSYDGPSQRQASDTKERIKTLDQKQNIV